MDKFEDTYFVPDNLLKEFCKSGLMGDQEGIYASYVTDPEAVKALLPPSLEMVSPVVTLYAYNMGKPSFTSQYNESALMVQAKFGDTQGAYFPSLMLSGPGALTGMNTGREIFGLPKKMCDDIAIRRQWDTVSVQVIRHGTTLMDLKMNLTGKCNNEQGDKIYGGIKPGFERLARDIVFRFSPSFTGDGFKPLSMHVETFESKCEYAAWTPGSVELTLQSTPFDPWGALPVVEPLGGGYGITNNTFLRCESLGEADPDETFPYVFKGFYDMGTMDSVGDQVF
jgi:hypothetical protein